MSLRRCGKSFFVVEAEDSSRIQENEKSEKPPGRFHPQKPFFHLDVVAFGIFGRSPREVPPTEDHLLIWM